MKRINCLDSSTVLIDIFLSISSIFTISLWIYYAIVSDAITSVAHFCALILGILLSYFFMHPKDISPPHEVLSTSPSLGYRFLRSNSHWQILFQICGSVKDILKSIHILLHFLPEGLHHRSKFVKMEQIVMKCICQKQRTWIWIIWITYFYIKPAELTPSTNRSK